MLLCPIWCCHILSQFIRFSHNTEKVIYFLLLERKRRRPALEDDDEAIRPRSEATAATSVETVDPPKKRLDTCRINGQNCLNFGQISEGSPVTTRRQAFKWVFDSMSQLVSLINFTHLQLSFI